MKTILLTLALFSTAFHTCLAEPPTNLAAGRYTLLFTAMSFTAEPKPEEKEITLPATLKAQDSEITIETTDAGGKPIKMSGRMQGTSIYLWMSDVEEDKIVTYHLTGKVSNNHLASGEATIFGSHQKAGEGKWTLTKDTE